VEGYKGWRCDSEKVVGWNVMGFGLDVCGFNDDCSYDFWWGCVGRFSKVLAWLLLDSSAN